APRLPQGTSLYRLLSPKGRAPVMLPAHLDAWVQTKPTPEVDPDIALWLHGVDQEQAPDVQLVWRADVTETLLDYARSSANGLDALVKRIDACAPVGLEAIGVPLYAVRAWLQEETARDVADVEGRSVEPEDRTRAPKTGRLALLWKGEDSRVVAADDR